MQIHELNTFAGTPGNNNYLPIDNGSDTGKISGTDLLKGPNDRIDNLAASVTPDSIVTLKTDPSGISGTVTLSQSVANFNFLDLYFKDTSGNHKGGIRVPVAHFPVDIALPSEDAADEFLYINRVRVSVSGTSMTVNYRLWEWSGEAGDAALVSSNTWTAALTRVDGVKTSSNTPAELADIRVGYDGVTYLSAGAAVRANDGILDGKIASTNNDLLDFKTAGLKTNCFEMVSMLNLQQAVSADITFSPSDNGTVITTTGTASGTYIYNLVETDHIETTPFKPGETYQISYSAPANGYLQIVSNTSDVVLNTTSYNGIKEITIPANCSRLVIRLYCASSVATGTYRISIVNKRVLDYLETQLYNELTADIDTLEGLFDLLNLFNPNSPTRVNDRYTGPNGSTGPLAGWCYIDVPVESEEKYSCYSNTNRVMVCYFDSSGNVVNGGVDYSGGLNAVLTIPSGASIMRCSQQQSALGDIRIFKSSTLDKTYYPYGIYVPSENLLVYSKEEVNDLIETESAEVGSYFNQNAEANTEGITAILQGNNVTEKKYPLMIREEPYVGSFIASKNTLTSEVFQYISGAQYYYDNTNYKVGICYSSDGNTYSFTGFVVLPSPFKLEPYGITGPYLRISVRKQDDTDIDSITEGGLYIANTITNNIYYANAREHTIQSGDSILEALQYCYANGKGKLIVEAGTYDVIAEYKAKYGNDYFDNYTSGYNGNVNGKYDYGLWLEDIEVVFNPGAKVVAEYTGNNANVKSDFSAFACGNNVTIDGLVLEASELRYGIHPDFNTGEELTTFTVKNCDLHHYKPSSTGPNNNQCLGCGLGRHVRWIFENNIFRSDEEKIVVRIHNNVNNDAQSQIIFRNCYVEGDGFIRLNSYSTSTLQTIIQMCGCSYKTPPVVGKETASSNDNFTLIAWNNEQRS